MTVKIRGFSKRYGNEEVFQNLNLDMQKGEILEIQGETGSGKTTLKRCIAGLESHEGEIKVNGEIAYLFQEERTLPWLNVRKNITTPLKLKGEKLKEEKTEEMEGLAQKLGVEEHLDKDIGEVSGGQLQRLLLIRALLTDPDLLLLDEPFNSLDTNTREEIYREITEICREREISVLIASHNTDTEKFAERTIDLEKEQKSN